MSRKNSKQRGVSLVEVMLTLALSSLLLVAIVGGRGSARSQAQFTDGIERIKESILTTKNQAVTSYNPSTSSGGTGVIGSGTTKYLNIGRTIMFDTASPKNIQNVTLLCYADADNACLDSLNTSTIVNTSTLWGITFTGYTYTQGNVTKTVTGSVTIVFARQDSDGTFAGYWYAGTIAPNGAIKKSTVFDATQQDAITLNFSSADGRKATVTVDPYTGTVTRQVL